MIGSIWNDIGRFVCEHYEMIITVCLLLLGIEGVIQFMIISSLEEDLVEFVERVEAIEKMLDLVKSCEENGEEKEEK